jgi:hypothetical protein
MPPQEHKHNEKIISLTEKEGKLLLYVAFDPAIPGTGRLWSCDTWTGSPSILRYLALVAFDPAIPGPVRLRSCDTWHWSPLILRCLANVIFFFFKRVCTLLDFCVSHRLGYMYCSISPLATSTFCLLKPHWAPKIFLHCELQVYMSFFYSFISYRLRFTIAAISFASLSLGFRIFAVRFDLKKWKNMIYFANYGTI